ncbi:MAG: hypothetical protein DRO95_05730 [Candidatus Altiarchaeales archaeon]|nr:MAG: hypothetical protein DRO95_05730 [Candidatus Altiarchaeales archaeon]
MFKILLMGNPNVGKSVVFSRLTGTNVVVSNYPGTTVDYTKGYTKIGGEEVEVIDVPGTFSLEPKDVAEEIALRMLKEEKPDLIIDVIDATKLERGLYLAFEIMERFDYPLIIDLNMWDVAVSKGIEIDLKKLREILGIPVIPTVAISGEGIKELADMERIKKVIMNKGKKSMNEHLREILRRIKDEEVVKDKDG